MCGALPLPNVWPRPLSSDVRDIKLVFLTARAAGAEFHAGSNLAPVVRFDPKDRVHRLLQRDVQVQRDVQEVRKSRTGESRLAARDVPGIRLIVPR